MSEFSEYTPLEIYLNTYQDDLSRDNCVSTPKNFIELKKTQKKLDDKINSLINNIKSFTKQKVLIDSIFRILVHDVVYTLIFYLYITNKSKEGCNDIDEDAEVRSIRYFHKKIVDLRKIVDYSPIKSFFNPNYKKNYKRNGRFMENIINYEINLLHKRRKISPTGKSLNITINYTPKSKTHIFTLPIHIWDSVAVKYT